MQVRTLRLRGGHAAGKLGLLGPKSLRTANLCLGHEPGELLSLHSPFGDWSGMTSPRPSCRPGWRLLAGSVRECQPPPWTPGLSQRAGLGLVAAQPAVSTPPAALSLRVAGRMAGLLLTLRARPGAPRLPPGRPMLVTRVSVYGQDAAHPDPGSTLHTDVFLSLSPLASWKMARLILVGAVTVIDLR